MITEKGVLPIGVEYKGMVHRDFEIRPQLVRDSIDAVEDPRAMRNESYLGLAVITNQIIRLGEIPKEEITPELMLDMYDADLAEIQQATGRLQTRLKSFRGAPQGQESKESGAGADQAGFLPRTGDGDGGDGSDGVS